MVEAEQARLCGGFGCHWERSKVGQATFGSPRGALTTHFESNNGTSVDKKKSGKNIAVGV